MKEVMTIEEIRERFDGEWVLLEDPESTETQQVLSGRLLWHCEDRGQLYEKKKELRPRYSAVLYIGDRTQMEFLF